MAHLAHFANLFRMRHASSQQTMMLKDAPKGWPWIRCEGRGMPGSGTTSLLQKSNPKHRHMPPNPITYPPPP